MKRSDLADEIYKELLGSITFHIKKDLTGLEESMILSMAADVLDLIEEKGILTPMHQERVGTGYADEYGNEETRDEWVQGWEQE